MKTYQSGQKVKYGIYVAPKAWDARFVGADDETLDGKDNAEYIHLPSALLLLATPIMGGVFVLAFPLIVIGWCFGAIGLVIARGVKSLVESQAYVVQMRWEPSAAYLNKTKREKSDKTTEEDSNELKDLKDEVDKKRNE